MPITVTLEGEDEARVSALVDSGAAPSAKDAVSSALRREVKAHSEVAAFWRSIDEGIAQIEDGRGLELDEVFDQLEARYTAMAEAENAA